MANIRNAFYKVRDQFLCPRKSLTVAQVATGPSCEQWINGEIYRILNWGKPRVLKNIESALGECKKRDITIQNRGRDTHVLEVKLLYQGLSPTQLRRDKLNVLRKQINHTSGRRYVGLVVALWVVRKDSNRRKYKSPEAFFLQMKELLSQVFRAKDFTTQHGHSFERMIEPQSVLIGEEVWEVQMRAAYVTKRV
jgi:hypothetical protein